MGLKPLKSYQFFIKMTWKKKTLGIKKGISYDVPFKNVKMFAFINN